jgi:hypothetical protein
MKSTRREILSGSIGATLVGLGGCTGLLSGQFQCEMACFEFEFEGFDDAPSWLTIRHVGGKDLQADEVLITGKVEGEGDYTSINDSQSSVGGVLKPWFKLDNDVGPTDGIAGAEIYQTDFAPSIEKPACSYQVLVLWEKEDDIITLDDWLRKWQCYSE